MAVLGTTIFSHIIPVILGVIGVLLIISGSLDESKSKFYTGVVVFVFACIFPYIALRAILL